MRSSREIQRTRLRNHSSRLGVIAVAATIVAGSAVGFAQFAVLTQHNDNSRTGANLSETILNTSNVNVNQFGKLFTRTVDGQVYAQPLYVPNVTIGQTTHNVVYVATMRNNLYAFDADDPSASAPLWQVNLGPPVPIADVSAVSIDDAVGITSTPVIDPATGTLYCVAKSKENGSYFQRLHAIDVTTGQERGGSPVVISGSVPGAGDGSVGGVIAFDALQHLQRPALVLSRGYVYIAFGSHEDQRPYHGWVFGYDATSLQRVGIYNTTPNGWGGAIWSSGQGPAVDENGDLYFMTANGTFNRNAGGQDCSSCFVKLRTPLLNVVDWFSPSNQNELNSNNFDLNSSGPLLLPGTNHLIGGGKEGVLYVLDRGNMGYFQAGSNSQIVQSEQITYGQHLHGSPIFWNSPTRGPLIYVWYEEDRLKAFSVANGIFQNLIDPNEGLLLPTTQSTMTVPLGMPGGILSLSANGSAPATGILWAVTPLSQDAQPNTVAGVFRAFDASNLGTELWNSRLNIPRDDFGNFAKYTPPTIANGKVYLATFSNQLVVYGLLGTQPAPTVGSVTPTGGSTNGGTAVTIRGTNFVNGASVGLGGTVATGVTVVNGTTITATTPAHAAGTVDVTVTNPDAQGATLSNAFTFTVPSTAPTVDRVAPSAGLIAGGTLVTLTGTNYAAGALVSFGGTPATGVTVVSSTTITVTTPAHAAGSVNVTVTNTDGQIGTITPGFTYLSPAPTVTSVAPVSGPTTGGTAVTVTGTNFRAGATLSLGGSAATSVIVVNATTIAATTPTHAAGAVTVTVTNSDAQSASLSNGFTYTTSNSAPTIINVTPASGATTGGTAFTVTGTGFLAGAAVTIGGTAATGIAVVNSTTISATTPAHIAGTVSVTVTNVDTQSATLPNAFTYVTPTAISFVQVAAATPQTPSTTVTVAFPSAQTPGDLNVIAVGTNDATSAVQSVRDSASNTYLLAIGPTIGTGLRQSIYYAKNIAGGANSVTVTFNQPAAYADVRILEYRGVNTLDVTTGASGTGTAGNSGTATTTGPNELIVGAMMVSTYTAAVGTGFTGRIYTTKDSDLAEDKVAATAGPNSATATTGGGNWVVQMAAFKLLTAPAPSVTAVAPSSGPTAGATTVTVTGSNFVAGATVTIGGTAATGVSVVNGTTITATTPAHSPGAVAVTVVNPDGQSASLANAFRYLAPAPAVSVVTPSSGPDAGGTAVTVSGTGFTAGATVTIGGTAATSVAVVNGTTITATTPAHTAGAIAVTVTNADGQSGTRADAFTYLAPAPAVSGVAPVTGSIAGGTVLTITGSHFVAGASLTIGGSSATNVTVVDSTTIAATTPAHAAGAVSVTVINADGQSGTLASAFTYLAPAPSVTSVTPPSGLTSGGTGLTIMGGDFAAGATVTIGGAMATAVTVVNGTTITATTSAHVSGLAAVTVTNPDGQSATLALAFTYIAPPPAVTGVTPASGPDAGGTSITVAGTGFMAGAAVAFDGVAATGITVVNSTTITAIAPAHAVDAVSVTVTNADGQSGTRAGAFTYLAPAPTVTAIAPASGPEAGGTAATIAGTNFLAGASVTIGGTAATDVTVVNSTTITAITSAHAGGVVSVTVTNGDGQSGALANAFTYLGLAPAITGVTPASGSTDGGTAITITGSDFVAGAQVTIGSTAATGVTIVNSTTIAATTSAQVAGPARVTVTNPDGQSATVANAFTYIAAAPTITGVTPPSGAEAGGTAVTITGTGFTSGAAVTFDSVTSTDVTVVNNATIIATTPPHTTGAVNVTVTNADGQGGTRVNAFTYLAPAPTVTSVLPAIGPASGGTAVTITGTNFPADATVSIGGAAAIGVTVIDPTTITATTVAHAGGIVGIVVTNADGQSGTLAGAFTYSPAPVVTGVNPPSGPSAGGTPVTISGTGFVAGAAVTIGGTAATAVAVANANTLIATTAAHADGSVSITVSNPDGQGGTLNSAFTYIAAPTLTSVTPAAGPSAGGTSITITGTHFAVGAAVSVGGAPATGVAVVNSTTLTATTPAHAAGTVGLVVTNADGQSAALANAFSYSLPAPTVTSVSPTSGPPAGGTPVTITGTGFVAGAAVTVGATPATGITFVNGTTITAITPAHASGAVNVTVTNPDGQSGTRTNGFTYGPTAISFIQVAAATPSARMSAVQVAYPAAQTAGDLNIVVVGWDATGTGASANVSSLVDSAGNIYSLAIGPTTGTVKRQSIYYASNIRGGANTVTVAFNQAAKYVDVRVLEYRGVSMLDAAAGSSGNGTSVTSGPVTTTAANELIFAADTANVDTTAAGAGFTARILTAPNGDLAADRIVNAAGTYTATATLESSSGRWVMQIATFK